MRSIRQRRADPSSLDESNSRSVEAGLAPLAQVGVERAACRPPSGASLTPTRMRWRMWLRSRLDDIRALAAVLASAARMAAASTGPRWERRVVGGSVAAQPRAAARMPPIRSRAHGCALDRTRPPHAHPKGRMPAGPDLRGVLSFGDFSLDKQRKDNRPPPRRAKSCGDAAKGEQSRSSSIIDHRGRGRGRDADDSRSPRRTSTTRNRLLAWQGHAPCQPESLLTAWQTFRTATVRRRRRSPVGGSGSRSWRHPRAPVRSPALRCWIRTAAGTGTGPDRYRPCRWCRTA